MRVHEQMLVGPERAGIKGAMLQGFSVGSINGLFPWAWALALWYGSTRVAAGDYSGGQVLPGCQRCCHCCCTPG